MLVWRDGHAMLTLGWFKWPTKLLALTETLRDQSRSLDIWSLIAIQLMLIGVLAISILREQRLALDWHFAIAAIVLGLIFVVMPYQLFGSGSAQLELLAGALAGNVAFGSGADTLVIDGGASMAGGLSDAGGGLAVRIGKGRLTTTNVAAINLSSNGYFVLPMI